jgi:hypothetical protein
MIKSCKFCKKEFNAKNPKTLYCGPKCKKGYENSLRGKPKGKGVERTRDISDMSADEISTVHTLLGQLTKVSTTMDQCVRFQIDVPVERVKFDTIQFLNQTVVVGFVDGDPKERSEQEEKNGKERFF